LCGNCSLRSPSPPTHNKGGIFFTPFAVQSDFKHALQDHKNDVWLYGFAE